MTTPRYAALSRCAVVATLASALAVLASGCVQSESKGLPEASTRSAGGSSALATSSGQVALSTDSGLCTSICNLSRDLNCHEAASCVRRCVAMETLPRCHAEIAGALGCFDSTPPAEWICNEHGLPSVRVGRCDAEQARVARCLMANPPVAPP